MAQGKAYQGFGEGSHLQAKERGLGKNEICQHLPCSGTLSLLQEL